ncbi:MAG: preprotein translocase subunit SecA [Pseudomonadota bacterium]|nr:preprotein translocase subunit SecA [Pseudomonadota bacterium]
MIPQIVKSLFGSRNSRLLKKYRPLVDKINDLEEKYTSLKDENFPSEMERLKKSYLESNNLEKLLPDAFALVREASKRSLGLRHFDEQLIGGIVLHEGKIAEMKTGEGKTLVATLPAFLNTLTSKPVFIVTVNDYLAQRDSIWMGKLFNFVGLSVGTITSGLDSEAKKEMYNRDIVYGTNNEFGFDYLRDNMVYHISQKVQSEMSYAIIDEVDSVLIDEARTPLVISGSATESSMLYQQINKLTNSLINHKNNDNLYKIDEKQKSASLTEEGHNEIEKLLLSNNLITSTSSLYDPKNISLLHYIDSSLKANLIYKKDIDYVVEDNQVVIIDEFSGRKMPGRRWSEGLHQAVEAKEQVKIQNENQTYASITFQNYFRLFKKISGMTGTADTEAVEFQQIYNLEVVVIPTNKKMIRKDEVDLVFITAKEKYNAIIDEIIEKNKTGQPILVGTTSIESSEYLSKILKEKKLEHSVLNAKYHQKEAEIIAQAGKLNTITIATNMAGRGTDIVLGGNYLFNTDNLKSEEISKLKKQWEENSEKVKQLGGLYIIGTERHESRRVDNQLRGRAGRQGDHGKSRFYLSLEDNLMRIFASEKVSEIMKKLGMEEGESIEHKWVSKSIENAQKRVEAYNFDIRKTLLEYDDIANEQRKVIYNQRNDVLTASDVYALLQNIISFEAEDIISRHFPQDLPVAQWNTEELNTYLNEEFLINKDSKIILNASEEKPRDNIINFVKEELRKRIDLNLSNLNSEDKNELIRNILLSVIDEDWRLHLNAMDHLRQGIGLRGYAAKNPKNEYKRESFEMFEEMLAINNHEIVKTLSKIKVKNKPTEEVANPSSSDNLTKISKKSNDPRCLLNTTNTQIPRNKKCPVTNKKFKQCCGKL